MRYIPLYEAIGVACMGADDWDGGCSPSRNDAITKALEEVDAVEVVRCKDCKKYREKFFPNGESYGWYCSETHYGRNPDDFCSCAERRE